MRPFEDEVHFGERVGLIGPNGSGKTQLIRLLAGEPIPHEGELRIGNRVSPGLFTQLNTRADLDGRVVLDVVLERLGAVEPSMRALARYRIQDAANRTTDTLSGGQKARLEILCLEIEWATTFSLLDEPTDNLDIDSSEALEAALESFAGTVYIGLTRPRVPARRLDRFLLLAHDGSVYALPDVESALERRSPIRSAPATHGSRSGSPSAQNAPSFLKTEARPARGRTAALASDSPRSTDTRWPRSPVICPATLRSLARSPMTVPIAPRSPFATLLAAPESPCRRDSISERSRTRSPLATPLCALGGKPRELTSFSICSVAATALCTRATGPNPRSRPRPVAVEGGSSSVEDVLVQGRSAAHRWSAASRIAAGEV